MPRPAEFYVQNIIVSRLGRKVKKIGLEFCTVELDGGEIVLWEKLLLATGGRPVLPQIPGIDKRGVFTFTTLDDAKAVDEFLDNIYSIEDLAQLVYALKEATNYAKPVAVKIAAVHNSAAIASGMVRAGADIIVLDGLRGSTGAAPKVICDNYEGVSG